MALLDLVGGRVQGSGLVWHYGWVVEDRGGGLGGDVAGAGAGQLVGVDEESPVGVARVDREHAVVDILLGALGLVAGGQQPARAVGVEAGLEAGGLRVVVVPVAVTLGDVLQDDPPVALHVHSAGDLGVVHVGGAEVALGPDPVAGVVLAGALAGAGVVAVVEGLLLGLGDTVHQVISGLVRDVSVLLEEEGVLGDLDGDVVGGVLLILHTVGQVRTLGTRGGRLGVAVAVAVRGGGVGGGGVGCGSVGCGGGVVGGGVVGGGVVYGVVHQLVRPDDGRDEDEGGCNLQHHTLYCTAHCTALHTALHCTLH